MFPNEMWIYLGIIFIHWVADFVLQSDWQAKNKSTNNGALFNHVFTYSFVWWIATCVYAVFQSPSQLIVLFAPITFVCHFITDYFTSRLNTKLWKAGRVHDFFVSVGFDQVLHYLQLFLTYNLLT